MGLNKIAAAALACALFIPGPAVAAERAQVKVLDAGQLPQDGYTVIKRIWTGTWRASFEINMHEDAASAISELMSKAADVGADAIINLNCLYDDGVAGGHYCYALAIKVGKRAAVVPQAVAPESGLWQPTPE